MRTSLRICVLAAALTGCSAPRDIQPQAEARVPAAGATIAAAQPGAWPRATWWHVYGDAQLDALVEKALADSPRLAVAADRIAQARAATGSARAALQPTVRGEASSIHTHFSENEVFPPPLGGGDFWDNTAQATFSYDLDLWGRDEQQLRAALAVEQIAQFDEQGARLALTNAIVQTYAQLALQFELDDNHRAILQDQQHTLDISQRRYTAGIGTELETQEIRTSIAESRAELEQIALRIALLRNRLGALTGGGPAAGDGIRRPELHIEHAATLPSSIPAELVGRRPDVVAERWRIERADANAAVARTAFYPNINLRAFAGLVSFGFSEFFDATSQTAGIGPALTLPLYDGGRRRSELQLRTSEYDAAVHTYNATLVDALQQVADEIAALQALERIAAEREQALNAATRARELSDIAFRAGLTDSLNVLHTQTALSAQRNLLAEARYRQVVAWAELNSALGGGFEGAPIAGGAE